MLEHRDNVDQDKVMMAKLIMIWGADDDENDYHFAANEEI